MTDLFETSTAPQKTEYSAQDIEVLEGLEPVRHRPGMYIGGTDIQAMHHLVAEILDNSMDEAVAGFANHIDVTMNADGSVTITDNGRGIPVDKHPKYPNLSALEVILTTLHSGGKFSNSVYKVSGGLHGVGLSVVNALSEKLVVEVAREKKLYRQEYAKGKPITQLELIGNCPNRRGTTITFKPDAEIFEGNNTFIPNRIYRMARSKAFLFKGIKINWSCAPELIAEGDTTPLFAELHFPNGLSDFLKRLISPSISFTYLGSKNFFTFAAKVFVPSLKLNFAVTILPPRRVFTSLISEFEISPQAQIGICSSGFAGGIILLSDFTFVSIFLP